MSAALDTGAYQKKELGILSSHHDWIGDVRGEGLFLGVEIVKDPESKTPHPELASLITNELRERHILISLDGPHHNVLKIKPPLIFNKDNVSRFCGEIHEILSKYALR